MRWAVLGAALAILAGCAGPQMVIQRAGSSRFHEAYSVVGVFTHRADVTVKGWDRDSAAIAVTMTQEARAHYSFVVDSVDDSLLLLGRVGAVPAETPEAPNVLVELPANARCHVETAGTAVAEDVVGPLELYATDSAVVRLNAVKNDVTAVTSGGLARVELAAGAGCEIDAETGPGGRVTIDVPTFKGQTLPGKSRGTIGAGGHHITVRGAKGVEVAIR